MGINKKVKEVLKMKNYIQIENKGFKNHYVYCEQSGCIYTKDNTEYPLFDYYRDFENMEIEIVLKICQKILHAYELGISKEQSRISEQINNLLGITLN